MVYGSLTRDIVENKAGIWLDSGSAVLHRVDKGTDSCVFIRGSFDALMALGIDP